MKKTLGVIPARMASSRFPGKPLKKILGIPMLAHCYERALLSQACDKLVIATPDEEIMSWAKNHQDSSCPNRPSSSESNRESPGNSRYFE